MKLWFFTVKVPYGGEKSEPRSYSIHSNASSYRQAPPSRASTSSTVKQEPAPFLFHNSSFSSNASNSSIGGGVWDGRLRQRPTKHRSPFFDGTAYVNAPIPQPPLKFDFDGWNVVVPGRPRIWEDLWSWSWSKYHHDQWSWSKMNK